MNLLNKSELLGRPPVRLSLSQRLAFPPPPSTWHPPCPRCQGHHRYPPRRLIIITDHPHSHCSSKLLGQPIYLQILRRQYCLQILNWIENSRSCSTRTLSDSLQVLPIRNIWAFDDQTFVKRSNVHLIKILFFHRGTLAHKEFQTMSLFLRWDVET